MSLSALIVARNEQNNIKECLESLSFVDEIVVVLDRTNDDTKRITKKYTKKIFSGSWEFEGDRRNFGIKKCCSDWVLEIDADEIVSEKLSFEIKKNILDEDIDFFYLPLLNFVSGKKIKYGWMACMAPDGKFCLFKKNCKTWENESVHPNYNLKGKKGENFTIPMIHNMSKKISDLIVRFNRNTSLHARDLRQTKSNYNRLFSVRKIFSRFLKCYFFRKGYKSGIIGLLVSILCSIYPYVSATKALTKTD